MAEIDLLIFCLRKGLCMVLFCTNQSY